MVKNKDLQKDIHDATQRETSLNASEPGGNVKVCGHLKKYVYIIGLVGTGLFLNSCMAGYVATEPSYTEYSRPPQPSNLHVWVGGDWAWSNQNHAYVQRPGYWAPQRQNRTYVSGYWQASSRGKHWVAGRWQKQNSRDNNRKR